MPRGPKPMPIPQNMPEAVRMYQSGSSSVVVAAFLNVAPDTAIKMLRASGVKIRRRGFAAGTVAPQVSQEYFQDDSFSRPPVTQEYLSILSQRWAEKIPNIVAIALQESVERPRHAR